MMPKSQMKSTPAMKLLSLMAERDSAIQERDMAISQRKAALVELEKVIRERDAAIAERDNAIMERDNAINAFQQTYEFMNKCGGHGSPTRQTASPGTSHKNQHMDVQPPPPLLADAPYDHVRQMHIIDARPISIASKAPKSKWMRKKVQVIPLKTKSARKRTGFTNDLNISSQTMHSNWKTQNRPGGARAMKNITDNKCDQENQDLGFNNIHFDESRIPGPVCSCTGKRHPCYKWGNYGWQSSCCTTTLSMHPLPVLPNRRYSRMSGRKMSGSVFRKLLIRLAAEGHDLSMPVDLKNHWAKHGTNAYITIR